MKFILLVTFYLLCLPVYSQKKLLILGSSTSTCNFGPSAYDSCYVGRLQKYYRDRGSAFILDNRAVSGDNCYHGMPSNYSPPAGRPISRPYYNITEGLAANPDIVLVNYPSNGYDTYSVQEVMFCLRTIKQTANNAGKPCYITTTQPRNFPDDNARRRMAEIKDSVLKEFGLYAINFWDEIANPADNTILNIYNADGTHLNNAGHAILFNRVSAKDIMNQTPGANGNGLSYRYYEGDWNRLPDFNSLAPVKTGSSGNIDLGQRRAGINDYFGFVWEGNITIPAPGNYTFETVSDDGSMLYFNSLYSPSAIPLVNNDGMHAQWPVSGSVYVAAAGTYPIAITYFEKWGNETMEIYWSGPGIPRQLIPNSAFSPNAQPANALQYRYYEGDWERLPNFNTLVPVKTGSTASIDLSPRRTGVNDYFGFVWEGNITVPAAGNYTFETVSDDGSSLYFNSLYSPAASPLVNNDGLHAEWPASGTVYIPSPGTYPIAITYFEKWGNETMRVYWSGPGFGRQLIPVSAFTASPANAVMASSTTENLIKSSPVAGMEVSQKKIMVSRAYPNPFKEVLTIDSYNTAGYKNINVGIYDLYGRLLSSRSYGKLPKGNTNLKINPDNDGKLAPGMYVLTLTSNGELINKWNLIKAK